MDCPKTHILVLENARADSLRLQDLLSEIPSSTFFFSYATTIGEALTLLEEGRDQVDLIFCDYLLEGESGLDFLRAVKEQPRAAPVIMITTAQQDRSVDLACMQAGAREYLRKEEITPEILDRAIRYTLFNHATERELKNSLKVREQMLSIISHDIASPLSTLRSALKLLRDRFERGDPERTRILLEKTEASAANLLELTQTLLSWAKTQTSHFVFKPTSFALAELVADELNFAHAAVESKSIKIANRVGPDHKVIADRDSLSVVVRNLLSNAIKFSHPGATITLSSRQRGKRIAISIKDEGLGMSADLRASLFNEEKKVSRPGTLHERGNGIGLMLCKALVERNGGTITVASAPNKGSTFTLTLPSS